MDNFDGFKKKNITPKKIILIFIIGLLFVKLIFDFNGFGKLLSFCSSFLISVFSYVLIGFIIAFILNAYMNIWEKKVFKKIQNAKRKRVLSIIIAYASLLVIVLLLLFALIPTLIDTVSMFARNLPAAFDKLVGFYDDVMHNGRFDLPEVVVETIAGGIEKMKSVVINYFNSENITGFISSVFSTTFSGIFNTFMGIMVSIYMLLEKDHALKAAKTITIGIFREDTANKIFCSAKKINTVFTQYFAGKLLQALIVLFLSYIVFLIAGLDYAILFAVILGVTNMIPYVGPWIGGIFVVIISLSQDLSTAITALVCVLIMQLIDNTILTPNIVGGQIGISPLLVLIGLCVCGGLLGLPGLILGDVFAAVIKILFYDTYIMNRIEKKIEKGYLPESARIEYLQHELITRKPSLVTRIIKKFKKKNK